MDFSIAFLVHKKAVGEPTAFCSFKIYLTLTFLTVDQLDL
jgi:hypothetical protein